LKFIISIFQLKVMNFLWVFIKPYNIKLNPILKINPIYLLYFRILLFHRIIIYSVIRINNSWYSFHLTEINSTFIVIKFESNSIENIKWKWNKKKYLLIYKENTNKSRMILIDLMILFLKINFKFTICNVCWNN